MHPMGEGVQLQLGTLCADGKWGKLNKQAQGEDITLHVNTSLLVHTDTSLKS